MGKVKNPAKQASKGRLTPYTEDQKPTTERGRRRSQQTDEYKQNFKDRQAQQAPAVPAHSRGKNPGPPKGPSKRDKGMGQDAWRKMMTQK